VTPPMAPAPTMVTAMRPSLSQGPESVNARAGRRVSRHIIGTSAVRRSDSPPVTRRVR
jgi:hypothetical protein